MVFDALMIQQILEVLFEVQILQMVFSQSPGDLFKREWDTIHELVRHFIETVSFCLIIIDDVLFDFIIYSLLVIELIVVIDSLFDESQIP